MTLVPSVDTDGLGTLVRPVAERPTTTVTAPATDEPLGSVPKCAPEDVQAAVERAREAQADWAARPLEERIEILRRVHDRVLDQQGRLTDVLQAETAKSRVDAAEEVLDIAMNARYYAERAPEYLGSARRQGAVPLMTKTVEHRHPKGVVGLITPWNYPLTLVVSDALPALVAGNAVVLKPAEQTPFCALAAARLLHQAGVPEDVFQVVTGDGPQLGEPLIEGVDAVGFTGSTETGRTVAEIAGRTLTEASLELGGKNPAVVLEDADVERAAAGAVHDCFANAGQLCVSIERIYVHEAVFDSFCDAFVSETRQLNLGVGTDWETDMGSLQSATQLEKVEAHVEDAVERGASVLTGGRARPDIGPFVYEPTVLTDVPEGATLTDDETFGPVVRLESVPDRETAIERANDSVYGLNATVWSGDTERGESVAARIDCGTVTVNDPFLTVWASIDAPMGGRGDSGIGRRHGRQGIEKYTDAQSVSTQRGPPMKPSWLPNRVWVGAMSRTLSVWNSISRWRS